MKTERNILIAFLLCYEHEADIFANQMKFAKNLAPYEIFVANLEAQNQDQLMIKDFSYCSI